MSVRTNRIRAGEHFERGYQLAQSGDYQSAALELQQAYDLDPQATVLFNLAQAYAASGQSIAAFDAFEEYLRLDYRDGDSERRRIARQLMEVAERRIGKLWIETDPAGAEVHIDGRHVGQAPFGRWMRLTADRHGVTVSAPGHLPRTVNVEIGSQKESQIFVRLDRLHAPTPALLVLQCPIPDMHVWVDGRDTGALPGSGFLQVSAGRHTFAFERAGYVPESFSLELNAGASYRYDCSGELDSRLERSHAATLVVLPTVPDALILIDGHASAPLALLPEGRHLVEVRARDHEPWRHEVELRNSTVVSVRPELVPTARHLEQTAEIRHKHRSWSKIALGASVAFTATAATLSWLKSKKHDAWSRDSNALAMESLRSPDIAARLRASSAEALEIQRMHDATLASITLGGTALAVSIYLWLTAPDVPGQASWSAMFHNEGWQAQYGVTF